MNYVDIFQDYVPGTSLDKHCRAHGTTLRTLTKYCSSQEGFSEFIASAKLSVCKSRGRHSRLRNILPTWQEFFRDYTEGPILTYVRSHTTESPDNVVFYYKQFPDFVAWYNKHKSDSAESAYKVAVLDCNNWGLTLLTPYSEEFSVKYPQKLRVRCKTCGTEYDAFLYTHNPTRCPHCANSGVVSGRELKVRSFLEAHHIRYIANTRTLIYPKEVDLYLPEHNLAFEFNGQKFHNVDEGYYVNSTFTSPKSSTYHRDKTIQLASKGISLIHIWDFVPDSLMYSIIRSKLNLNTRVYARKLSLKSVSQHEADLFFTRCHVDGSAKFRYCYGLYNGDALLCCIGINTRRIQSTGEIQWEIGRYANELNTTVVGGYSRLLIHALPHVPGQLISYCNRDLSPIAENSVYNKLGFELLGDTGPSYWYFSTRAVDINGRHVEAHSRIPRQWLQGIESTASSLGLVRCFNSGNWKYILR